ncbi:hypothetical protein [Actinomadura sp. 9N407]|uniref:hypothetical protein n=1 Tax=Actinomadura sp. 9N407 TaxID=3375154 RepID=UPI0037B52E73
MERDFTSSSFTGDSRSGTDPITNPHVGGTMGTGEPLGSPLTGGTCGTSPGVIAYTLPVPCAYPW